MKCHDCRQMKHHSPGSWLAVAEHGDDPYDYDYCASHHWSEVPVQGHEDDDLWDDCKDFRTKDYRY